MFRSSIRLSQLSLLIVSAIGLAPRANAGPAPTCFLLFTKPAVQAAPTSPATSVAPASSIAPAEAPIGKPNGFNLKLFETTRDRYINKGIKDRPKTPEAKAALIAAGIHLSEKRDVVNLEEWIQTASAKDIKALAKSVGRIDPRKGISPRRAENLFVDILALTHTEKGKWNGLLTQGFSAQKKVLLLQWARTEFAQKPFVETLDGLGLVKEPGVRDAIRRKLQKNPNVTNTFNAIFRASFFMTLFPAQFAGVPLPYVTPKIDLLARQSMSSAVRAQITRRGIDASYDSLNKRYGKLARFELAYSYARHIATGAMIAYAITQIYPGFMSSLMPPGYINPDQDGALEMGVKVLDYYTRLALLIRWDGITGKLLPTPESPAPEAKAPAAPQLPDALPPGASAQAATDASLDSIPASQEAASDYAPPSFDPAPDMPPDVPADALPSAPPAAGGSSAVEEAGSSALEF